MEALARALTRKVTAWVIIAITLLSTAGLAFKGLSVGQDDDLLAFLPRDNPDVALFNDVNQRFGGLDVAIVGIRVDDPFDPAFLEKLLTLTRRLDEEPRIAMALSLANVEDFEPNEEGGVTTKFLAQPIPETEAEIQTLRERTMSLDHIVGNLIGPDGKAVIIYSFLDPEADPRATGAAIRERVHEHLGDEVELYWGGGPYISSYIYDTTQADMRRLLPWAVALVVLIIVLSFRDLVGALLALISTGMGIAATYGAMGIAGVDANIVLSAMPVILFAVGSAYAIHVLVRYYALRKDQSCEEALVATLVQIGPTVLAAGLTTVAGLLSFTAMDIEPMRQFGIFTGLGIATALLLSLTFVPAVIRVTELTSRDLSEGALGRLLARLVRAAQKRRLIIAVTLGVVVAGGAAMAGRVEARMESAAFFAAGSPPARANAFLAEQFGGSTFIQVMIEGDMNDPGVLREVQRIGDRIALEPPVTGVDHVAKILGLVYDALAGERRVPPTTARVRVLYRFLAGSAALKQLLTEDRHHALIIAKVDTDAHDVVAPLLERVEQIVAERTLDRYRVVGRLPAAEQGDGASDEVVPIADADRPALSARRLDLVVPRVRVILKRYGANIEEDALRTLLRRPAPTSKEKAVAGRLAAFLRSDESILTEAQHTFAPAIADAVAALGPDADVDSIAGAIESAMTLPPEELSEGDEDDATTAPPRVSPTADEELVDDITLSLEVPLEAIWRGLRAEARADRILAASRAPLEAEANGRRPLSQAVLDLELPSALLPADGAAQTIDVSVSGTPVLYRGMSESVTRNQFKSLGLALALVLLIMVVLFRSFTAGLLAASPTVVTLLVIYGVMGATHVYLDIGTSMLASIIIGAGVDYAVHLLAAWRGDTLEEAGRTAAIHTGTAIWTNALMVAAGFFVLTLGEAKPLENVGGLTAAAMVAAALATFVAIPALARRTRYSRSST